MFLKIRTHCMNQPWRTEDTDCRNRHCALPAPFNHRPAELREHQAPYCSLWLAAKSADLFTSTNRFNFTNGFNSQSTSVYFRSSWFFFLNCVGLNICFINLLNWPEHLNFLWNEATAVCYFWCITWVWTDDTAWTSTMKTPLCPSTHFIGGVWDGIFCDGKKKGIIFLLMLKQKVCLHKGLKGIPTIHFILDIQIQCNTEDDS